MKEYWNDLSLSRKIRLIFTILIGICAIIFAARNWKDTEVILVFLKIQMPLTLVIVLSSAIGFAIASLFDYRKFKVRDQEIIRLKKELEQKKEL